MQIINLPKSGQIVTLKEWFTHGMEIAFKDALTKGVGLDVKGGETVVNSIPGGALDRAAEAVLMKMIEKVTKDNQDIGFGTTWLEDLPESDFLILREHVEKARNMNEEKKQAGKKNS